MKTHQEIREWLKVFNKAAWAIGLAINDDTVSEHIQQLFEDGDKIIKQLLDEVEYSNATNYQENSYARNVGVMPVGSELFVDIILFDGTLGYDVMAGTLDWSTDSNINNRSDADIAYWRLSK